MNKLGRAAIFVGPFLVIAGQAIPEKQRGLRTAATVVGGVLTALGLARDFAKKGGL